MQISQPDLEWIDSQSEIMTHLVEKWAGINSWSDNLIGLSTMLALLLEDFAILKGEISILPLAKRKVINSRGILIEMPAARALSIRKRPEALNQVFLGGHMDTVFPPSHPFQQVEKIDKDTLRGPGVTDMKGGLAVLLKTLESLERSSYANRIGWEMLINPDEEIGSPGSTPLFAAAAKRAHLGLIFEPSFADGALVNARKGSANYTLIARGQASHAGRDFSAGKSAIYALADLIRELEGLNDQEKGQILNVGYIEGGGPVNIVPELAICRLNTRAVTAAHMQSLREHIQAIVHSGWHRRHIQFELIEESFRMPKVLDANTQRLIDCYQQCAEQLRHPFSLRASGGVTDGNTLAEAGLPTLDSMGVIGGNIHTDEEYLHLPSLTDKTKLNALFLFKLASGEIFFPNESSHV